jgi:hypothetical protein
MFTKSPNSSNHHYARLNNTVVKSLDWHEYYQIAKSAGNKLLEDSILKGHPNDNSDTSFAALFIKVFYHWGIAIEIGLSNIIRGSRRSFVGKRKTVSMENQDFLFLAENAGLFTQDKSCPKKSANHEVLKKALILLEDIVRWNERYPYHSVSSIISKLQSKIPFLITCGLNFILIIKPLFDFLDKEITSIKA